MKKIVAAALVAAACVSGLAAAEESQEDVVWHGDLKAAWKVAKASGDPMLLYVTMQNCRFCNKMAEETLIDERVTAQIAEGFVPVKVQREAEMELVKKLGVRAYPTTIIVLPNGKVYASAKGYVTPERFARSLRTARESLQEADGERTARLPR